MMYVKHEILFVREKTHYATHLQQWKIVIILFPIDIYIYTYEDKFCIVEQVSGNLIC